MDPPPFHSFARLFFLLLPSSCFLLWLLFLSYRFLDFLWFTPRRHRLFVRTHCIRGPPPRLLVGNVMQIKSLRENSPDYLDSFRHDLTLQQIIPDHVLWSKVYGKRYVIWWGPVANVITADMDLIKELFSSKFALSIGKPSFLQKFLEPVTGMGIVLINGEEWAHERRLLGSAFHFEKLKEFAKIMVSRTSAMLEDWHRQIEDGDGTAEIEMGHNMAMLTADIIALTQFGSSYERGKKIFKDLEALCFFVLRNFHLFVIPGLRFLPIPAFRELRRLRRTLEKSIREIIEDRKSSVQKGETDTYGPDLLGLMLTESEKTSKNQKQPQLNVQQLVDECKTFFFAGHETTAQLLTWTILLLAANTSWQERARAEVNDVCKGNLPNSESISRMKIVEMILFETLRLYGPVDVIVRTALYDMTVGGLFVPKGMCFSIPLIAIHLDPELWGDDVYDFNPDRFAEGMGKAAKHPLAFLPFAHGPRNCIGQNFALMEAKVVLATILPRFKFISSTNYRHSPQAVITVRPKYGAPVIVERV